MPARELAAAEVGLPRFDPEDGSEGEVFSLSSHHRAREALQFGLQIADPGFNIFVLGEDRSGRMTATMQFLRNAMQSRPPPDDWVYLNNFRHPHRPRPVRLPAGVGRRFHDGMAELIPQLREAISRTFNSDEYQRLFESKTTRLNTEISHDIDVLRREARAHGLDLVETEGGTIVDTAPDGDHRPRPSPDARQHLNERLHELNRSASRRRMDLMNWFREHDRQLAEQAIEALLDSVKREFSGHPGLARWLNEMGEDILDTLAKFRSSQGDEPDSSPETPEHRYAVNLLVDHADDQHPSVVLEPNPTYENLFGRIEYRQSRTGAQTDFALIRAGALHRANGGVLVVRADALASDKTAWSHLKGALRDQVIRVEELHRQNAVPLAGAPRPKPIPLELKVVLVGAPRFYYDCFSEDADFYSYFKVKADIDPDMDATPDNVDCLAGLIQRIAAAHRGASCEPGAVRRLLGVASRWSTRRDKLTARFELVEDIISEAVLLTPSESRQSISEQAVIRALANRRRRNARAEDRFQESIVRGGILIDVTGRVVGQINALTVRNLGDHEFGGPSRVTARASIGRHGVINIERVTSLGGPIQQKGVLGLQGFLAGKFARHIPLSFNCSITFEQNYGGVEGDSASLAELIAILSDLSGLPVRQDIAITGSVNQLGLAQPVGSVHQKIEGFFRTCTELGIAMKTQGVIIPTANEANLVLRDEVAAAVAAGRFHVWSVTDVESALELYLGVAAGRLDANGEYPPDSVYGRVLRQLRRFDEVLAEREGFIRAFAEAPGIQDAAARARGKAAPSKL